MLGRRCDIGCMTWPDDKKYNPCPICGEKTTRYRGVTVDDEDEINHALFEAFYENEWTPQLEMTPEESLYWASKYPDGRPDPPVQRS